MGVLPVTLGWNVKYYKSAYTAVNKFAYIFSQKILGIVRGLIFQDRVDGTGGGDAERCGGMLS
jgi:hypothetical protein